MRWTRGTRGTRRTRGTRGTRGHGPFYARRVKRGSG